MNKVLVAEELVAVAEELVGTGREARLKPAAEHLVRQALERAITRQGADWEELVDAVEATGAWVPNWLDVRAVLQGMISQGRVRRVDDVHHETYVKV